MPVKGIVAWNYQLFALAESYRVFHGGKVVYGYSIVVKVLLLNEIPWHGIFRRRRAHVVTGHAKMKSSQFQSK